MWTDPFGWRTKFEGQSQPRGWTDREHMHHPGFVGMHTIIQRHVQTLASWNTREPFSFPERSNRRWSCGLAVISYLISSLPTNVFPFCSKRLKPISSCFAPFRYTFRTDFSNSSQDNIPLCYSSSGACALSYHAPLTLLLDSVLSFPLWCFSI